MDSIFTNCLKSQSLEPKLKPSLLILWRRTRSSIHSISLKQRAKQALFHSLGTLPVNQWYEGHHSNEYNQEQSSYHWRYQHHWENVWARYIFLEREDYSPQASTSRQRLHWDSLRINCCPTLCYTLAALVVWKSMAFCFSQPFQRIFFIAQLSMLRNRHKAFTAIAWVKSFKFTTWEDFGLPMLDATMRSALSWTHLQMNFKSKWIMPILKSMFLKLSATIELSRSKYEPPTIAYLSVACPVSWSRFL